MGTQASVFGTGAMTCGTYSTGIGTGRAPDEFNDLNPTPIHSHGTRDPSAQPVLADRSWSSV
jgi:hypothetical protein